MQIEGAATCVVAPIAVFILPDYPGTTRWLSEDEKWLAAARLAADDIGSAQGHGASSGHLASLKESMTDWRTWCMTFLFMMVTGAQTIQVRLDAPRFLSAALTLAARAVLHSHSGRPAWIHWNDNSVHDCTRVCCGRGVYFGEPPCPLPLPVLPAPSWLAWPPPPVDADTTTFRSSHSHRTTSKNARFIFPSPRPSPRSRSRSAWGPRTTPSSQLPLRSLLSFFVLSRSASLSLSPSSSLLACLAMTTR